MSGHAHHHNIRNIKIATFLNIGFTLIEFVGGVLTNSLAILADALHDLGDSLVLISSWKIEHEARREPDWRRTFGYRRLSLLAAFLNAVIILGGSVVILFQVAGRLISPEPVNALGMMWIAVVGVIANFFGSLQLKQGQTLNEKILSWHLLEDVLGWLGILVSAVVIYFTDFYLLDPLLTIAFTTFILWGVWRNSKELINVFLEGVPQNKDLPRIVKDIEEIEGVKKIYDVHLWSLDGKHNMFTMEAAVMGGLEKQQAIKKEIEKILEEHKITHSTIELNQQPDRKEQEQIFLK